MRQIQPDGVGRRPLAYDNIQSVVLHGGVQNFLHGAVQPVDLVDKEDISLLQIAQDRCHFPRFSDGRSRSDLHMCSHLIGNDSGERGLSKSGRSVEQHMVERFPPRLCRLDIYF